jgi:hypothetical protein
MDLSARRELVSVILFLRLHLSELHLENRQTARLTEANTSEHISVSFSPLGIRTNERFIVFHVSMCQLQRLTSILACS